MFTVPSASLHRLLAAGLVVALPVGRAVSQCEPAWRAVSGLPGTDATVYATTTWDPDGAGPAVPIRVFGGDFTIVGGVSVTRVATWNPATGDLAPLGSGMNGSVLALAVMPNGELVAGGDFSTASGAPALGIARWTGTAWAAFPSPLNSRVRALAVLPSGRLVVAGDFTSAGGTAVGYIAQWDGVSWQPLGSGTQWPARTLAVLPNGDLVAGGDFSLAGGTSAERVARWDGSAWHALGTGIAGTGFVRALTVLPNGDLIVGGQFTNAGGVPAANIARWDGSSWSPLGGGVSFAVGAIQLLPNGDLFVGAYPGGGMTDVARWNGGAWTSVGGFYGYVWDLDLLANGEVLACGGFWPQVSSLPPGYADSAAFNVARWDGTAWVPLVPGTDRMALAVLAQRNGDVIVGGKFKTIGGVGANRIAIRSGGSYAPLGAGMDGTVMALAELQNGDLIAAGEFLAAGGVPASRIARWDGAAWHPLGTGLDSAAYALHVLPNGDLLASGPFATAGGIPAPNLARWDGTTWSAFGSPTAYARAFATMPNGDLVVGGGFSSIGGTLAWGIAKWDGAVWTPLNFLNPPTNFFAAPTIRTLTVQPDGDLVAGGTFWTMGDVLTRNIARWNGSTWNPLGPGTLNGTDNDVYALATLPSGDVLAAGRFASAGGQTANHIARWNGATWSALDAGTDDSVHGVALAANGDVYAAGAFVRTGSIVSPYVGQLVPPCPATVTPVGSSCASSGGSNTLTALTSPWVHTTFRALGSGLPPTAIVLTLTSVTAVPQGLVPLTIVSPLAGAGCDVLVAPDILGAAVTTNGTLESALALPDVPPLVGVTFFHQMVPIEVDAQGAWLAVTATNALQLTAGIF